MKIIEKIIGRVSILHMFLFRILRSATFIVVGTSGVDIGVPWVRRSFVRLVVKENKFRQSEDEEFKVIMEKGVRIGTAGSSFLELTCNFFQDGTSRIRG